MLDDVNIQHLLTGEKRRSGVEVHHRVHGQSLGGCLGPRSQIYMNFQLQWGTCTHHPLGYCMTACMHGSWYNGDLGSNVTPSVLQNLP